MVNYNCVIATHQGRIRCLIDNLLKNKNIKSDNYYFDKNNEIYRFKNSCILKITITKTKTKIELLHDGEVDEKKPDYVYFSKSENNELQKVYDNEKKLKYSQINFNTIEINQNEINQNIFNVGENEYTFYLLRHGQGYHNTLEKSQKIQSLYLPGFREKILDASLTNKGIEQAEEAGNKLNDITFDYYFASDLKRTRQTLLKAFENKNLLENNIIILPCNHEVTYPNCDKLSLITPNENVSSCQKDNHEECGSANWEYYKKKYNGYRSSINTILNRDCSNINIISEAINIIEQNNKQKGGYFKKYLKYKHKYLKLKNTI